MKTSNELLTILEKNQDIFHLPLRVEKGDDVVPELTKKLKNYKKCMGLLEEPARNSIASSIVDKILNAIREYYNGKPVKAHGEIFALLDIKLSSNLLIDSFKNLCYPNENKQLYKARIGNFYPFSRKEMFHVPFNKRKYVKTNDIVLMVFHAYT